MHTDIKLSSSGAVCACVLWENTESLEAVLAPGRETWGRKTDFSLHTILERFLIFTNCMLYLFFFNAQKWFDKCCPGITCPMRGEFLKLEKKRIIYNSTTRRISNILVQFLLTKFLGVL